MRKWTIGTLVALLLCVGMAGDVRQAGVVEAQEASGPPDALYHAIWQATQEFAVPGGATFMVCIAAHEGGFYPGKWGDYGTSLGFWQFKRGTFRTAMLAAGYPLWMANDWSLANDPEVATRAAAALMSRRDLGGVQHWTARVFC